METSVIDYIRDVAEFIPTRDGKDQCIYDAGAFFDSAMQYTPVAKLSGGEKTSGISEGADGGAKMYFFWMS